MIPLRDTIESRRTPYVTWGLIALNIAVFCYERSLGAAFLPGFLEGFGLVPARFTDPLWAASASFLPGTGISILMSLFLHMNWAHLAANLWTLWIFGDNVEDRMGHARFLLFYFLTGLLAGVVHCLVHPHSTIPAIGASGSIAGVLGAYILLFPKSRIVVAIPIGLFFFFARLPAIFYLLIWIGTQIVSGTMASLGSESMEGIAWWAHTGAFLSGVAICRSFLLPAPRPVLRPRLELHWPRLERKWPESNSLPSHRLSSQGGIAPALSRSLGLRAVSGWRSSPSATSAASPRQ
jgi:membrane associated rhomboid family serine protease